MTELAESVRETVDMLSARWISNGYPESEARALALRAIPREYRRELLRPVPNTAGDST